MKEVLDTRFFMEHFYSDDSSIRTKTRDSLQKYKKDETGILPTIVISEIVNLTCERRGKDEAELRYLTLLRSGLVVADLTSEISKIAGMLKCMHSDMPYNDCIISATAILSKATVVTDDPHFRQIKELKLTWIK